MSSRAEPAYTDTEVYDMELFLSILNFMFVIIGVAAVLRFAVWKLTSCSCDYHYIVLLDGDDAELRLREAVEKNRFDINTRSKVVYAVNVGLDDETARACEMMSHDNPQIVFCRPEQLGELIRQY